LAACFLAWNSHFPLCWQPRRDFFHGYGTSMFGRQSRGVIGLVSAQIPRGNTPGHWTSGSYPRFVFSRRMELSEHAAASVSTASPPTSVSPRVRMLATPSPHVRAEDLHSYRPLRRENRTLIHSRAWSIQSFSTTLPIPVLRRRRSLLQLPQSTHVGRRRHLSIDLSTLQRWGQGRGGSHDVRRRAVRMCFTTSVSGLMQSSVCALEATTCLCVRVPCVQLVCFTDAASWQIACLQGSFTAADCVLIASSTAV
jgi:hypothetical protein